VEQFEHQPVAVIGQGRVVARPLVTQEGVLAVDLVPLEVGPDLFQPGPDQVAAVERDMRVLPAPSQRYNSTAYRAGRR
jgi:hypothetical protein